MLYMCVFIQIYDIQVNHMITNSTAFIGNIHSCGISQENKPGKPLQLGLGVFLFFNRSYRFARFFERTIVSQERRQVLELDVFILFEIVSSVPSCSVMFVPGKERPRNYNIILDL